MSDSDYQKQLKICSQIALAWASSAAEERHNWDTRLTSVVGAFPAIDGDSLYQAYRNHKADFDEEAHPYLVVGKPVRVDSPTLYPVAMLCVGRKSGSLRLSVRVAVFYSVGEDTHSSGWRLELADQAGDEAGPRWTGTSHVQRITSWTKNGAPGFHTIPRDEAQIADTAERAQHVNEARPAFSIPVSTPSGLMIAAMGSLYGGGATRDILSGVALTNLRSEVDQILGNP